VRFDSDTIQNIPLTNKNPIIRCFTDTLYYWAASIHQYSSDLKINLFPNPASDAVQLQITGDPKTDLTAHIFSLLGEDLMSFKVNVNAINAIGVLPLSNGSYVVKIQDESGRDHSVLKLVIDR
jgi:hypothetical protein